MGGVEYRTMRRHERGAFLALMEAAFVDEDPGHFARYLDQDPWLGDDDTLLVVESGRIVSAVQIFTRTIRLRGRPVLLGGIGSVATHPDSEGRGHATALLRAAVGRMRDRGMALSLLFTGRTGFYQRLGWVPIPHPVLVVRRGEGVAPTIGRCFESADLPEIERVYDVYSGRRDGTTVRDATYWRAQLRFAGNPDERFDVAEREGRIVAYARRIPFVGMARIMELGCEPGAVDALAGLLVEMAPAEAPLFVPRCDAALEAALGRLGASCETVAFPDQMWRVIDGDALRDLAGAPEPLDDADLLARLVSTRDGVFWPSDRF